MARPGQGRKENHVKAQRRRGQRRVPGDVVLSRLHDAPLVDRLQRLELAAAGATGLDLDEDGNTEAAGDKVDLADRRLHPAGHDTVELGPQVPAGEAFAAAPVAFGAAARVSPA